MNLYLHVEITSRELDSKLLLAVKAVDRGHDVLIGSSSIINPLNLFPGIFHTKSLTPSRSKLAHLKRFKDNGHLVTSIDEEHGLLDHNYESFATSRFSEQSLNLADATFCWGPHDYSTLISLYPDHKQKFHCIGSPRADLWIRGLKTFWGVPQNMPEKPYVLVSSNFGNINNYRRYWDLIKSARRDGYYDRVPDYNERFFNSMSEQPILFFEFLKAIEFISETLPDLQIVVRPHPVENPESWKAVLPSRDNIHVIRTGSITPWVHHALAVIHNGCTTALEAIISGTPLITYTPFEQKYGREVPNQLGFRAYNKEELLNYLLKIKQGGEMLQDMSSKVKADREIVSKRVRFLDQEMAADRMIKVWEQIGSELPDKKNNWIKLQVKYGIQDLIITGKQAIGGIIKHQIDLDFKFPPLDMCELRKKIEGLRQDLGITREIKITKISKKSVVISAK